MLGCHRLQIFFHTIESARIVASVASAARTSVQRRSSGALVGLAVIHVHVRLWSKEAGGLEVMLSFLAVGLQAQGEALLVVPFIGNLMTG